MNDGYDATKAEFDQIVREPAADHVSRATAAKVSPLDYEPRPLAPARGVVLAVTAVILAVVIVWVVVVVLAATSSAAGQ